MQGSYQTASLRFPLEDSPGEGVTKGLAKGVCMYREEQDLSEEGMGFGVPVVVSRWRTYLSFRAPTTETSSDGSFIRKVWHLDAVQCVGNSRPNAILPYLWLETKGLVYKGLPWAQRWLLDKRATGNLTPQISFAETDSRAEVTVDYRVSDGRVDISVDLASLNDLPGRPRAYVLNEQGGRAFPVYRENGQSETDEHNGGWAKITAESAGFAARDGAAWFSLGNRPGASMFRGRELVDGLLSWSGIEYEITRYPEASFDYSVEVGTDAITASEAV
jgi:hypothetical protein